MYGFEEYYDSLLTEAKSPEEIRRIIGLKFPYIPSEVIDRVFAIDPTKKKTYTSWALNRWNYERSLLEDIISDGRLELLFHYYKTRNNEGLNLVGVGTIQEALDMLPEIDTVLEKIGNGPENNFEIVYDTPEWKIAVPHSYEASKKLGKGCRWCTAGAFNNGEGYYNTYSSAGPLWINFDYSASQIGIDHKEYPYTRYQFLFEWRRNGQKGEFMDFEDRRKEPSQITSMPDAVKEFYASKGKIYSDAIYGEGNNPNLERRRNEYLRRRLEDGLTIKEYKDGKKLLLLQRLNDMFEVTDGAPYYVYSSDDTNDPLPSASFFQKENAVVRNFENFPLVLLKNSQNDEVAVIRGSEGHFDFLPMHRTTINDNGDYIVINVSARESSSVYSLFADKTDYAFIRIPAYLDCMGRRRKVIEIFKNKNLDGLWGQSAFLEIELDNGFHMLFVQNQHQHKYNFLTANKPIGDNGFYASHGEIIGMYGNYIMEEGDMNFKVFQLINKRYAIVRRPQNQNKNSFLFKIYDSVEKNYVTKDYYTFLTSLGQDGIVFGNKAEGYSSGNSSQMSDNRATNLYLISTNTNKDEYIGRVESANSFWVGKIFQGRFGEGIRFEIPYSYNGIEFMPENEEESRAINDFLGTGQETISEMFNKFYNRMTKKQIL